VGLLELVRRHPQTYNWPMRKSFGSAFALIMVALFTVAPTSPATAAGAIHLHIAGQVGQKAVGSTIIFGAEGVTDAYQWGGQHNGCLDLRAAKDLSLPGWGPACGPITQVHDVPASGSFAGSLPLPALPAGNYSLIYTVTQDPNAPGPDFALQLQWNFTIASDGTFFAISSDSYNS